MGKNKKQLGAITHHNGVSFRVWAPFASSVELIGSFNDWARLPMEDEGDGYWYVLVKEAEAGQEYKFVIHNGEQELFRNDPRALKVTTNMGNSVITDTEFDWEGDDFMPAPLSERVVYELHVGTFNRAGPADNGTFHDTMAKLDYLAELGINTIELMPIGSMENDHGWGYVPNFIYAIESLYGGRRDFMEFVKEAHARGIGVVLDVVYNHFGPNDGLDLWQFDGWSQDGKGGIYFYNDWRSSTPWGETRPDYGRPEVQQYILDNVRQWMQDCHLDGLRVDSTIFIRNVYGHNDDPANDLADGWKLLQQANKLARKINENAFMLAEDIGYNDYLTKATGDGGAGFSAQWEVTFPHTIREALSPVDDAYRNISAICDALDHRYNGDAFQRVLYSDSHDSAANGSKRLDEEISPGNAASVYARERSLLAATIVLTAPGIPMLFQGQEFMQGGSFNYWQALDWHKAEQFKGIVLAHKHLIALRKNIYGITRGLSGQSLNILHRNDEGKVLAYHRWDQGGAGDDVVIIINFTNKVQRDYSLGFPRDGLWKVRFNSDWKGYSPDFKDVGTADVIAEGNNGKVTLGPYAAVILSQDIG
ncbi:MAG TPA: alpha-amylase family glycosyl hydrolase [Patescibacteria group bacterium]|nr:alpha-amylase family glycosyl hydrolase [Patescibacteria group bacterium]